MNAVLEIDILDDPAAGELFEQKAHLVTGSVDDGVFDCITLAVEDSREIDATARYCFALKIDVGNQMIVTVRIA